MGIVGDHRTLCCGVDVGQTTWQRLADIMRDGVIIRWYECRENSLQRDQ